MANPNPSPLYEITSTATSLKGIVNCSAAAVTVGLSVTYPDGSATFSVALQPGQTLPGEFDVTSTSATIYGWKRPV
jgi:hypothetical protein